LQDIVGTDDNKFKEVEFNCTASSHPKQHPP